MNANQEIDWIAGHLLNRYGKIEIMRSDPLGELVLRIRSQNTNDTNRDRAYLSLIGRIA